MKTFIAITLCVIPLFSFAQYTELINSNRPGVSKSAYSVGVNVIQVEAGAYYVKEKHTPLDYKVRGIGIDFAARYGLLWEPLEIILDGTYQRDTQTYYSSSLYSDVKRSNIKYTSLGAKYLVYDPNKNPKEDKPDLYNWKENQKYKWSRLIPAVSLYIGANYDTKLNPYTATGIEGISPKIAIGTQHNFAENWVFIMNLSKNRIGMTDTYGEDASDLQYIFTLTHAVNEKWVAFGEYEGTKSDFYSDDLFRLGTAYLWNKDLQFDASMIFNVKDSPSVFSLNFGASYRIDLHKDKIISTGEGDENGDFKLEGENENGTEEKYYKLGEDADNKNEEAPTEYKMNK